RLSWHAEDFAMDPDELLEGHKGKAQAPPEGEPVGKKNRLGEMADAADDELAKVEGALKAKDIQQAVNIRLKMACAHAQQLKAAGKECAEVTAIQELKSKVGPPHLYIARAAFKSLKEDEKVRQLLEPSQVLTALHDQFLCKASMEDMGLVIRHFRVRKCYNEKFCRIQFSISGGFQVPLEGQSVATKLLLEQSMIKALTHLGGKLKLGSTPI
ncbi:unnamed protein product, partial [Prorocentrum cordatum]